ncbi:MAG TPA: glutamate formimidoyltransferase [Acidobacteriota bacterium]|jgi:glutamate formiminotransferase/formiminotetrahydrofolate cyclodeaminase|nr:glutamate formimidoyltransferase [Acidobacteriota bacterium]
MSQIVECVMNFSEGRDQSVIDRIVAAIESVPGITVLDQEKDSAHHRSVITFIGSPEAVAESAVRATGKAAELIDLTKHRGEHPRIGATDVVPFVPIKDVTLEDCVAIARNTGEKIARQFGIPVYLYEAAATRPDRQNLADIRKGEFELLRDEIAINEARNPDFGERRVHPTAGATVVGAREPLIAYNVYLETQDVSIAKEIAKAVRFSGGGLPFVKALGFSIPERKQTQVSMNLVNYKKTPIYVAFEKVKEEAIRRGVSVASSEVVGLVPQSALLASAHHYLQIEKFSEDLVLENRIQATRERTLVGKTVSDFLDSVSAVDATPGGGSVAALAVSLAAGLGEMVCNLTTGKKKYAAVENEVVTLREKFKEWREESMRLIDQDARAFQTVMAAYQMERGETRDREIQEGLRAATEIPMQTATIGRSVIENVSRLCDIGNQNALSDTATAAAVAVSGIESAACNVAINLRDLTQDQFKTEMRARLDRLLRESRQIGDEIRRKIEGKLG